MSDFKKNLFSDYGMAPFPECSLVRRAISPFSSPFFLKFVIPIIRDRGRDRVRDRDRDTDRYGGQGYG